MAQHTANLVITAKVAEIVTQKHIALLAGQTLQDTVFEVFRLHRLPQSSLVTIRHYIKISTGKSIFLTLLWSAKPFALLCLAASLPVML